MTEPPTPARRGLAVVVGLFVLWQLIFLLAANLIDSIPRRPGPHDNNPSLDPFQQWGRFTDNEPLQRSAEVVGDVLDFWSEVSGQEQGWRLFVPGNPPHTLFPRSSCDSRTGRRSRSDRVSSRPTWRTPPHELRWSTTGGSASRFSSPSRAGSVAKRR